jgi:hypothetical protein
MTTPITAATIKKPIMNAPTPRVHTKQSTATNATPTPKMTNPARNERRDKLRNHLRSKQWQEYLNATCTHINNIQQSKHPTRSYSRNKPVSKLVPIDARSQT